ncbi:hypothetical protein P1X16_21240 [Hymenobacter sp. YC55]|nr:hypothetical protein [Hymenobacter sp. YC55]
MKLLTLLLLPLLVVNGCSSDDSDSTPDPKPIGPKEYAVEYRITGTNAVTAQIIYRDATGTEVVDEPVNLPKTYSFKRTMKQADVVSCGVFVRNGTASSSVKSEVLIDGKSVETKNGSGQNAQAISVYLIP